MRPALAACVCFLIVTCICCPLQAGETLALEDCIREALEKNPGLDAARYRVEAAGARIDEARAAYYPQAALSAGYSRTDNPPEAFMMTLNQRALGLADPAFDPNNPDDTDNVRLSANARYRIWDGQRRSGVAAAVLGEKTAREYRGAVQNELIHVVTRGYYSVLQAEASVAVQREAIRSLEESLRVSRERFDAGAVVKTDVLNLEVKLAQAREDLIRAGNSVELTVAALNTAMGVDLAGAGRLSAIDDSDVDAAGALPAPAETGSVITNRAELRAAARVVQVKEAEYARARGARLPEINAFGSLDGDAGWGDDFEDSYTVGVMVEWDCFDGFQRRGNMSRAKAEWAVAVREERALRHRLNFELRQAVLKRQEAAERLKVILKSVESAEESLRVTRDRYKEGAADIAELVIAQTALTAMRTRNVAARYECLIARSDYERAAGTLVARYAALVGDHE